MTREKILSGLSAGVLVLCLGFGGVACMVTGLHLRAGWLSLAFGCIVGAVTAVVCLSFPRGGRVLGGIGGAFCALMAVFPVFMDQLKAMLYSMFRYYHMAYGVQIPEWFDGAAAVTHVLPLLIIAGLVMAAAAWAILRRKTIIPAVAAALMPLTACVVVTDTVPANFAIVILLFGLAMLMMTSAVRRRSRTQGNRLMAILALPVAAALMLLMMAVPRDQFQGPVTDGIDSLLSWFTGRLPAVDRTFEGELVISFGSTANQKVNLSTMGRNYQSKTPVMEIESGHSGKIYLRGRSYDTYSGKGWSANTEAVEELACPNKVWTGQSTKLTIKMISKRGQYYLPYYAEETQTLQGGMLPNPDFEAEYSFRYRELIPGWEMQYYPVWMTQNPASTYLNLPEDTRLRAEEYLKSFMPDIGPVYAGTKEYLEAVSRIESHVAASAAYDLKTDRMPASETDFALWFLEQSDTGYCVHFATAATVLLRAVGIPARYVEGYAAEVSSGQTTVVRENNAHAWVEYYVPGMGWVIVDPTPGGEGIPDTTQTAPPETTQPPATEPSGTEPEPSTADPTQPTGDEPIGPTGGDADPSVPGGEAQKSPRQWFGTALLILAGVSAAGAAVLGQWTLRRRYKLRQMHRGKPNMQALVRFREVGRMAKLLRRPVPDDLMGLAEKARFSQHTLTKEELTCFDAFLRDGTAELKRRGWYHQLIYRFVYAMY